MTTAHSSGKKTALILPGGGARSAYEIGILAGIMEIVGHGKLFDLFYGMSVGAINAAFLVSFADNPRQQIDELIEIWSGLKLRAHIRFDWISFFGIERAMNELVAKNSLLRPFKREKARASVLNTSQLETIVRRRIDWPRLRRNIQFGTVDGLIIPALQVDSGRTSLFAELNSNTRYNVAPYTREDVCLESITPQHILAASAIPIAFPARRIGKRFYCDGSLRFSTPLAPAIRCGAERLVVISLQQDQQARSSTLQQHTKLMPKSYLNPMFLLGKICNALLLDPVAYDLQVLSRFNKILTVLQQTLNPVDYQLFDAKVAKSRGNPYRTIDTLIFWPSRDLGQLAREYLEQKFPSLTAGVASWFLRRASLSTATWEADFASYFLFEKGYIDRVIALGRNDAHRRSDQIRTFFR